MKKEHFSRTAALFLLAAATSSGLFSAVFPQTAAAGSPIITNTPEKGTLTIHKTDTSSPPKAVGGAVYTAYRILSLTPGSETGEFASFSVMEPYRELFHEKGITADALGNYSASHLEALITELEVLTANDSGTVFPATASETGETSLELPLGWYLIVETNAPEGSIATAPFLAAIPSTNNLTVPGAPQTEGSEWIYDIFAAPKASPITVDKTISNGQAEHDSAFTASGTFFSGKNETAALNDYIQYSITAAVPAYGPSYFHKNASPVFELLDTMSSGLTIQNSGEHPVTVRTGERVIPEKEGDIINYTFTAAPKDGEEPDLSIKFTDAFLRNEAYRGKEVTVSYYAKINEQAVMGTEGNTNNVVLSYENRPGHTITASPEKDDPSVIPDTYVYTYGIEVEKFSEEAKAPLQGAEFKLFKDKAMTQAVSGADGEEIQVTDPSGSLAFPRLDAGTYYLKEVKSPSGYSLLSNPVKIQIIPSKDSAGKITNGNFTLTVDGKPVSETEGSHITRLSTAKGIATIAIENHKGFSLPATGGSGIAITVLISASGLLVITIFLLRSKKKDR